MSTEVVRPQDVLDGDLRNKLHKAVIAAYMATEVINAASGHSIKEYVKMEERGGDGMRFYYKAEILWETHNVYCDYPGSDWDLDNLGPNLGDYPGFTGINANSAWESLKADVDAWLDPWVNDCPNPNDFENQINSVARIASQLNIGGGDSASGPPGGDTDLREAVKTVANRAYGKADAMVAFRDAYASDLWTTINNQCGMATAAGLALTAEGSAWSETYRALRDFIQVAIYDFATLADAPGTENHSAALSATAAVAGLLGATIGVVFPPFGVAMGGLSAAIGMYTVMHPAVPAVDRAPLELSGSSFNSMWDSFTKEMLKISDDLEAAERGISDGCSRVVTDTYDNPESYSLTRGLRRGKQYDNFKELQVDQIQLTTDTFKQLSGAAEVIADQQTTLGSFLREADAAGNPASQVQSEWSRGLLPLGGRIGLDEGDSYGPYRAYNRHINALAMLLKIEGENSHDMAEKLMRAALDFDQQDRLTADEHTKMRRHIDLEADLQDKNDLIKGNDPNDPWYDEVSN